MVNVVRRWLTRRESRKVIRVRIRQVGQIELKEKVRR